MRSSYRALAVKLTVVAVTVVVGVLLAQQAHKAYEWGLNRLATKLVAQTFSDTYRHQANLVRRIAAHKVDCGCGDHDEDEPTAVAKR